MCAEKILLGSTEQSGFVIRKERFCFNCAATFNYKFLYLSLDTILAILHKYLLYLMSSTGIAVAVKFRNLNICKKIFETTLQVFFHYHKVLDQVKVK